MSKKQKKKSNGNGDISDSKVSYSKPSSDKLSSLPSSQKSNGKHGEKDGDYCAKQQSTSQRLDDSAGYRKPQCSVDLKNTAEGYQTEISKRTQPICGNLVPTEARGKIVMHFKNKTELGKKSSMASPVVVPRKESSNVPVFDVNAKKRRMKAHDLKILNTTEKKKKVFKLECAKVKETIARSVLEKKKNKKLLKLHEFSLKQNISKKPHPTLPSFYVSDPEVSCQSVSVCKPERAKDVSLELPGKSNKEMTGIPLTELSRSWKYKQKKQSCTDSSRNIVNTKTQGTPSEPVAFHTSQQLKTSSHTPSCEAVVDQEMQIVEELHAARIDKKMALPVVQACGELTSMEIDLPDNELTMSAKTPSDLNSLIVIDTNIMISHLSFIKSLKNTDIPGIGRFVLVIPWVVLQELDNLKKGKILANVGQQAVPAVHFIYTCLKRQDPKLWGQSVQLASQKTGDFCVENNDDRVLQCCLQYKNLFPQAEVVLLTDDKNLCSKALVSEIQAFCKADFAVALQKQTEKAVVLSLDDSRDQTQSKADPRSKKNDVNTTDPLSVIILELEKTLYEVLSFILETEMKIAFGELWPEVVYHKPPWTLMNVLDCYKKHWMAVFGLIVSRDLLSTVEYLNKHLCKAKVTEHSVMEEVLKSSQMLLEMFSSRSNYDGAIPQGLAQMNKLLKSFEKIQSSTEQNISNALKSTPENVACEQMEEMASAERTEEEKLLEPILQGNRHLEIWSVFESAWMTIIQFRSDVFQKLDLNTVVATQNLSSFKEAFIDLQKLMAAVSEIITGIRRILMPNSSFQDVWPLYNFLTSNEINNTKFTAEELYDCISQKVYRDRLSVGCEQLLQLEHSVKQCYETVCLEIQSRGWI